MSTYTPSTAFAGWAWRTAVSWAERRKAFKALHECDDHILKDIGLSRCQIGLAVNGQLVRRSPNLEVRRRTS